MLSILLAYARFKKLIYLSYILLLACSQGPYLKTEAVSEINTNPKWNHHQNLVKALTQYQVHGTLLLYSNNQKLFARFYWKQISPHHYQFLLSNLLGMTELQLEQKDQFVYIHTRDRKCVVSEKYAEYIIFQLTGIMVSLKNFSQWIMGLPGASTDFRLDSESHLRELSFGISSTQLHIFYLGYRKAPDKPAMPSHIELYQGKQRIKLKIDQ
ncbi:Outer-membrane lipoprotein LolB precursor [Candidatus Erwinia haradaeae]|uniref:Outer-membrane lipoprotein LolB n=1 Tax=Candidatus Erwinia haradaeae TaxID=1922217 RepID=A0A451DK31_9GAMM|nr:lipoprotein insertase outer membrane protein LolB [Candidatus Erwinia haradaeae]VFP87054.1 Outer-membrane lipoprotein LolB precursor [Candidatus Erwinia haradaeae]